MHTLFTCLLALSALFLSAVAAPVGTDDPNTAPSGVYVNSYSFAGSGCPANTVATTWGQDGSIILSFSDYIAEVGPGIPLRKSRKNCQINIDLVYPPGWSYSVVKTDYRGFISLDKDVTATQKSDYFYPGSETETFESVWYGELVEDYEFTDTIEQDAAVWSPCKQTSSPLSINTQIRVDNRANPSGSGMITTDSITHRVTHVYYVEWRRC